MWAREGLKGKVGGIGGKGQIGGALGSQMPLHPVWVCVRVCVCVCVCVCVPWRWLSAGGASEREEKGWVRGGRCFQRGPSLLPKGGGDLLSHPVKVSHWCSDTHTHTYRNTHNLTLTYTHTHAHADILQTLHRKLWAIMRRHLRADGCVAQTKRDTLRLW